MFYYLTVRQDYVAKTMVQMDEFVNSERVQDVRTNGADLCDYCEEGIDYVGDKENQWRRPQQIK